MTIHAGAMLRQWAQRTPERAALVDVDGVHWSYGELDAAARDVAGALVARGLQSGDRVALQGGNSAAFLAGWFGILYAGACVVPIPVVAASREIAHRRRHAGCRWLLAEEGDDVLSIASLRADARRLETLREPSADEAMILYTSGTTGSAKGAIIGHTSLWAHTAALVHHTLRLRADDVVLGALPLTHSYGIRMAVLAPFFAGARSVLRDRFDAAASLDVAAREGVTWLPGVPTMFAAWADAPGAPWGALRWCLSAGAPLTAGVRARAEARLGASVREGYGLTEATFSCIDAPPADACPGSVGRPVWGVELSLRSRSAEEGEILVRGPNAMRAYLDAPEATAAVVDDGGWIHTGDLGRIDEQGRLHVVGRLKDMIIRGGHNVYPAVVEAALAEHAAISEVAVVGRPDPALGEEVVAVIVLAAGASLAPQELDTFVRERVAKTAVPREIAVVDALPLGPSRKVLKRVLREQLESGALLCRAL